MARRRTEDFRVLGPYPDGSRFRIVVIENGERRSMNFETEVMALAEKVRLLSIEPASVEKPPPAKTIREALKDYEAYMLHQKGNKPNSVDQTLRKLRRFFPDVHAALTSLEPAMCDSLYETLRTSPRKMQHRFGRPPVIGKPISVDYHRNILAETKTFLGWCVSKQWIASNPLAHVEGYGRRRHGKEQLRINEARKWILRASELAHAGEPGAVAAMMTLLMGMRCSEIVSRVARDVDDDGRILWIPDSKTEKGRRTLQIPDVLKPHLDRLVHDKDPEALIFGTHTRAWVRKWVQRICREVRVKVVTAHGQRGLHSTLAVEHGVTPRAVADALGHESFATTAQSYATPEAVGRARSVRVQDQLTRGLVPARPGEEPTT